MQTSAAAEFNGEAWSKLGSRYRGALEALAVRSGLSNVEGEQIANEVLRSARRLEAGVLRAGAGGVRAWLYELARWRIADRLRRSGARSQESEAEAEAEATSGRGGSGARGAALDFALYRVARRASGRDFHVYELATKQAWSVFRISRVLGIHPLAVCWIKYRLSRQVRQEVAKLRSCWK